MVLKEEPKKNEAEQEFISLVTEPAIEMQWFEFASHQENAFKFSIDEQRQILTGVALVPDMPIYRKMKMSEGEEAKEFYVVFEKQTVFDFVKKFMKNRYNKHINISHNNDDIVDDAFLFESLVVDESRGMLAPKMFEGVRDGSWVVSLQIEDKNSWERIKREGLKGFSVQAMMGMEYVATEEEGLLQTIADMTKGDS